MQKKGYSISFILWTALLLQSVVGKSRYILMVKSVRLEKHRGVSDSARRGFTSDSLSPKRASHSLSL